MSCCSGPPCGRSAKLSSRIATRRLATLKSLQPPCRPSHVVTTVEESMTPLVAEVLEAHGGLERWRKFTTLSATIVTGGEFWSFKGVVQDARPRRMTVDLHNEWASVDQFGDPDWRTDFTPDRIAI